MVSIETKTADLNMLKVLIFSCKFWLCEGNIEGIGLRCHYTSARGVLQVRGRHTESDGVRPVRYL